MTIKGSISLSILAVVAVIVVDLWLRVGHPLAKVPTVSIERGETYNAVNSYKSDLSKNGGAPHVVLMGSSLMVAPVMQAESMHLNKPIERFFYRRATVFDDLLKQNLKCPTAASTAGVQSYCLAIGGEMASDAYLIAKHVLTGEPPVAIIYGIAPRDFQENLMSGIQTTQTYQALANVTDLPMLFEEQPMSWEKQADCVASSLWQLWRYRTDVRSFATLRTKKLLEALCPLIVWEKYGKDMQLRPQRRGQFPEEAIGTPRAVPGQPLDHSTAREVRDRYATSYNPVNEDMVKAQFDYFSQFLADMRKKNVSVLVVNMPLSKSNKSLLPGGFYDEYLQRAKAACAHNQTDFIDMNYGRWDDDGNFIDTVHLKPQLSKSFLSALARAASHSQITVAIEEENARCLSGKPQNAL